MTVEFLATVTPFAMTAPDQFRMANPPPDLTSESYTTAYNEVKEKGSSDTTKRTRRKIRSRASLPTRRRITGIA